MRQTGLLILLGLICISILFGVSYWPSTSHAPITKKKTTEELASLQLEHQIEAEQLLADLKPQEAMIIIRQYDQDIDNQTELGRKWLDLFIEASIQTGNTAQLTVLYEYFPEAFETNEEAAITVANTYILAHRNTDYTAIRRRFSRSEAYPEKWISLDVDQLILEGRHDDAVRLLRSQTFEGQGDTTRLIRLALLTAKERPKESWQYLTEAYKKNPKNADIRSYRARLLENVGQNDLALAEYVAATQIEPNNLYLQDQLAEFDIRQGNFEEALKIWASHLQPPSADFIWIKTLFWNRVAVPIPIDWKKNHPPKGPLRPLVDYIEHLPPGTYWDSAAFGSLAESANYLKSEQSTFWLRLIEALNRGQESEAWNLLQYNPYTEVSWAPDLELALKRILTYRKDRSLDLPKNTPVKASHNQPFFSELAQYSKGNYTSIPSDVHSLLTGPDAFATAFLVQGWLEGAVALLQSERLPEGYPNWVAPEFARAIDKTDGIQEALSFAQAQERTETLSLFIAEALITEKQFDSALKELRPLIDAPSDIGFQATLLTSLILIEKNEFELAREVIQSNEELSQDLIGKETMARIALFAGEVEQADTLYAALEKDSSEAKSYLARRAFAQQDWRRARKLTEELLKQHPTNTMLLDNLKKIHREEKLSKSS